MKDSYPFKIFYFELKVRTLIDYNKNKNNDTWGESILVKVDITKIDVKMLPKVTFVKQKEGGFDIPFHPNIKIHNQLLHSSHGEWLFPNEWWEESSVFELIVKLYQALRFNVEYISISDRKNIGNEEAFKWFDERKNSDILPTGHFSIEQQTNYIELAIINPSSSSPVTLGAQVANLNIDNNSNSEFSQQNLQVKKKFQVKIKTEGYKTITRDKPNYNIKNDLLSEIQGVSKDSSHELYISLNAQQVIFTHLAWGGKTKENSVEQGGLLLGNVYIDPTTNGYYGIIEYAIPSGSSSSSSTHISMGHEHWGRMLAQIEQQPDSPQIIGWYHTHPNHLDVFLSEMDLMTQRTHFQCDWHFAIVLNPHKKIWRAFIGKNGIECKGFFLTDDTYIENLSSDDSNRK
jgi:proteasome lid subunit RPN8/RPN11